MFRNGPSPVLNLANPDGITPGMPQASLGVLNDLNRLHHRQIGARTWVWLNDQLVVDGVIMENFWDRTQPLTAKGPIMLQTHGGEIRWRNIFVREISAAEAKKIPGESTAK